MIEEVRNRVQKNIEKAYKHGGKIHIQYGGIEYGHCFRIINILKKEKKDINQDEDIAKSSHE